MLLLRCQGLWASEKAPCFRLRAPLRSRVVTTSVRETHVGAPLKELSLAVEKLRTTVDQAGNGPKWPEIMLKSCELDLIGEAK